MAARNIAFVMWNSLSRILIFSLRSININYIVATTLCQAIKVETKFRSNLKKCKLSPRSDELCDVVYYITKMLIWVNSKKLKNVDKFDKILNFS